MYGTKIRIALTLGLLLLAAFAGLYLSGYITLLLLKLDTPLEWSTWWQYFKALDLSQFQPFAKKIKFGGAVGFGIPLLLWAGLLAPILKRKQESMHGDASFATKDDLRKAGLLTREPEGILLGNLAGRDICLGGAQHVLMTAATRTGKTASVVIPVLKTYPHSIVCADLKGELFDLTSGERKAMGHRIFKFAPYDVEGNTQRFNPFTALSDNPGVRVSQIQSIAAVMYPDGESSDPFWTAMPRAAFTAFASFMFENYDDMVRSDWPNMNDACGHFPSFERILEMSSGTGDLPIKDLLKDLAKGKYVSSKTRGTFNSLSGMADDTFTSVIATMQAPLQQFVSPILAAATNASDFDVRRLRKELMTIYMVIPAEKLGESSKLMNIFFSLAIGNNLDRTPQDDPSNKYQVLMLMDEFGTMGRIEIVADRISIMAGFGVRCMAIAQSLSQLRAVYGSDTAQSLVTNFGASIVFTPREQEDANKYSEMLGYKTIRKRHRSTSHGAGGGGVNYNYTEERRALMLPQEIKELPKDDLLIFYEGCKPIRAKKNWWFRMDRFKKTQKPPVVIPKLKTADESRK